MFSYHSAKQKSETVVICFKSLIHNINSSQEMIELSNIEIPSSLKFKIKINKQAQNHHLIIR